MSCVTLSAMSNDSTEGRDWFIMSAAHTYAIEHFPEQYRNRKGCMSGEEKDSNYLFIEAVMDAYKAGVYNESFNKDKW